MSIRLSDSMYTEREDVLRKDLLAFVKYPRGTRRCVSYPQYAIEGEALTPIAPSAFADRGCLPMSISGGGDADSLFESYGQIVVMRVNRDDIQDNTFYPATSQDQLHGVINPAYATGRSQIEFKGLDRSPLSSRLVQVVEVEGSIDLTAPVAEPVQVAAYLADPMTSRILVEQEVAGTTLLFGPFEASAVRTGGWRLEPASDTPFLVKAYDPADLGTTLRLSDIDGVTVATFVDADQLPAVEVAPDRTFDWIGDDDLAHAVGRLSRIGDEGLTKEQARNLRGAILTCSNEEAGIGMTEARRARMVRLLDGYCGWAFLDDEGRRSAIAGADPNELAAFAFNEKNFSTFLDRARQSERVRQQMDQVGHDVSAELAKVRDELAAASEELEVTRANIEDTREEALAGIKAEVAQARAERDGLAAEVARLQAEADELGGTIDSFGAEVRSLVDGATDQVLSQKVIESALVRRVVEACSDRPAGRGAALASREPAFLGADDLPGDAAVLLDLISERLAAASGREMDRNDVANLMTCLTQGYVTTLSGLPGTGKTSLAVALGAALGLDAPGSRHFVQVGVERGWTSYKDFVGFFNPLTGAMVKSNQEVFDALEAAGGLGEDAGTLPWLFLLDEANLSSIEHYWAPFLGACGTFRTRPLNLSLGGDASLLVPSSARFLCTVNFDHTTEELSPRFLDRSWVITLDPRDLDLSVEPDAPVPAEPLPAIPMAALDHAFAHARQVPDAQAAKLRSLLDACTAHGFSVSPRSQRMMTGYVAAASRLMDTSSTQTTYAPVDYAFSQKVLPQVAGPVEKYGALVEALLGIGGLPLTARRLERMVEVGEDSGFYQFFA